MSALPARCCVRPGHRLRTLVMASLALFAVLLAWASTSSRAKLPITFSDSSVSITDRAQASESVNMIGDNFPLVFLVRVFAGAEEELRSCLIPSLKLFWPSKAAWKNAHILFVWDDESQKDHLVASKLEAEHFLNAWPRLNIANGFSPLPSAGWSMFPGIERHPGHDRQQYANFIADLTLESSGFRSRYVGFGDSDAVLSIPALPSSLFLNKNGVWIPRVLAYNGYLKWSNATSVALGPDFFTPGVIMVVIGFPIIVHTAHLEGLRRHMVKTILKEDVPSDNRTASLLAFDRAFKAFAWSVPEYSQFDIIGTYLWHRHRSEYHWIFRDQDQVHHPAFKTRATSDINVLRTNDGNGEPWIGLMRHNCHNAAQFEHITRSPYCVLSKWQGKNCTQPPDDQREAVEDGIMSEQFVDWGDGGAGEIKQPGWQKVWRKHVKESRELPGAEWEWIGW